jgi:hypothetical protein
MSPQVQTVHLDGLMREQRKWHASQKAGFRVNEICEHCNSDESTVSWVLESQWALSVRQLTGRSADMRWPIVPPLRTGAELALFASRDEIRIRQQLRPGRIVVPTLRPGRR